MRGGAARHFDGPSLRGFGQFFFADNKANFLTLALTTSSPAVALPL
jgi:hypothetical protein